ncbi:MAG: hypothetical protein V7K29_02005 [Nostoc sp.]
MVKISLFLLAFPEPRDPAPVSKTIAAFPVLSKDAQICYTQPQSADCFSGKPASLGKRPNSSPS